MDEEKRLARLRDKPLTRKQEKFVKELVSNDGLITAREAARRAGYSLSSCHTRAYEMMNRNICPNVAREIERYRNELDEQYAVNYKRSERDLKLIRDAAMNSGAYSAAVQSEIARGRLAGLYTTKSEIRTGSIDAMSREEVEAEIVRIRSSFEKNIIDITPEKSEQDSETGFDEPGIGVVASSEGRSSED